MPRTLAEFETSADAILGWIAKGALARTLFLLALCLAFYLPGFTTLPPTDRDESRFIQASLQMAQSGDLVDIRFQDQPRHKKPAGIYWLQAGAASLTGGAEAPIWAYRLPSLLAAIIAVLALARFFRPLAGDGPSLLGAAFLGCSVMLTIEGHLAKTDAALLASIVIAQGALARLWLAEKPPGAAMAVLFWCALAAGILIKGPIAPLAALFTILWLTISERSLGGLARLRLTWGPLLMLALAAPWFIAIGLKTDGAFFAEAVGRDMIGKIATGQEAHGAPPGYFLGVFWGVFWPFAPLAVAAAPVVWRKRRDPVIRLLIGWIVPLWLMFELVSTKLPHYVLPTFPAIAMLIAITLHEAPLFAKDAGGRAARIRRWVIVVLFALPAIALPLAGAVGPAVVEGAPVLTSLLLAPIGLLAAWIGVKALLRALPATFILAAIISAGTAYASVLGGAIPSLDSVFPSARIAAAAKPYRECLAAPVAITGYTEPSLVFAAGADTLLLDPEGAGAAFATGAAPMVFVEDRLRERFDAASGIDPDQILGLATVEGFNYNRGKRFTLRLLVRKDAPGFETCP